MATANYAPAARVKLRLRTGGSSASVSKSLSTREVGGMHIDIGRMRLPVRHRYRSPVFIEFYPAGHGGPDAYAALWLLELTDGEDADFDLPIFRCSNGLRLSRNYMTQDNYREMPDMDMEEVGRVRFRGRFSAGTDSDHVRFVSDNDSRETIEAWEACYAEGVRQHEVHAEVPPLVQRLHDESLTHGRDVLAQAGERDKKWLAKDDTDWSGAFDRDSRELMASKPGEGEGEDGEEDEDDGEGDDDQDEEPDLGVQDGQEDSGPRRRSVDTQQTGATESSSIKNPYKAYKGYRTRSRDLHRRHRGLMQWRPMRNAQFAKDEAKFALRKVRKLGALDGRQPDVETEV